MSWIDSTQREYAFGVSEHDYVLGTEDDEIARLGLQHRVWRERALACWDRAGVCIGSDVLDVGAGPGFASLDLCEIVGESGSVTALERSSRFIESGRARTQGRVDYRETDLVLDELPNRQFDVAWCRWVMSFVSDPQLCIAKVAERLKPGGRFALHEYFDYATWQFLPDIEPMESFVRETMQSWREAGGEPNIAKTLPSMLASAGLTVERVSPIFFAMRPRDYAWQWPAAFIRSHAPKFVAGGRFSEENCVALLRHLEQAEQNPESILVSPVVMEIIAVKSTG
ncbi:MAG: methyltransferase domain-containing protein [Fimbriimonadaceae bacterium]